MVLESLGKEDVQKLFEQYCEIGTFVYLGTFWNWQIKQNYNCNSKEYSNT